MLANLTHRLGSWGAGPSYSQYTFEDGFARWLLPWGEAVRR